MIRPQLIRLRAAFLAILLGPAVTAPAVTVSWTDWLTSDTSTTASGTLLVDSTSVDVDYSGTGSHAFVQTAGGVDYWVPSTPYDSGLVENAPPTPDIVALNGGGTVTVTFSEPIEDPYFALVSWNGNTVVFDAPIEIISYGAGYWGNGTPVLNVDGDGFTGNGEVHGVIKVPGVHDSISFTHLGERWHGFTVGVAGLAVPEPASLVLAAGLIVGGLVRRR